MAVLTFDNAAKRSFQEARRAWERSDPATRSDVAPLLEAHLRAFPRDATARPARAMLALLELDAGDSGTAWELAEAAREGPPGVVRDDADVVRGAVMLRRDDAPAAMEILRPLDGKIIDAHFRDVFDGELADAAVRTGDAPRALAAMRRWLGRTPSVERGPVHERISSLVALMPEESLHEAIAGPLPDDDEDLVIGEVAARLASIARDRRDALLARFLLDRVPDRLGADADPLAAIAARSGGAVVAPQTVGLLVSTRSGELSRRALEVAAGLSLALRAERPSAEGAPRAAPTLLSRAAQGGLDEVAEAAGLLAADGAGIVVGGLDQDEADALSEHATRSRLPVVLLVPPRRPPSPDARVFVLGEDPRRVRSVLLEALARDGRTRVAVLSAEPGEVAPDEAAGSATVVAVQPCGAALDFARTASADALLVEGGPDCARAAAEGLSGRRELRAAFTLDAATDPAASGWLASAGLLPARPPDPALAPWTRRGRGGPSWWAALGHDAGRLTLAALDRVGGAELARDAKVVEARRADLAAALAIVELPLWTTERRGFEASHRVSRDLQAVSARP